MRKRAAVQVGAVALVFAAVATAVGANRAPAPGDGEAIATIMAIDSAGIIHADLAMTKKPSAAVPEYVHDIRSDYAADAEEIAVVAKEIGVDAAYTVAVRTVHSEADELVRTLDALDGPAFEKAYLDSAASGHAKALVTIDRLTRMDLSDDVKAHLKDMRGNTQKHLDKAKALRTR